MFRLGIWKHKIIDTETLEKTRIEENVELVAK